MPRLFSLSLGEQRAFAREFGFDPALVQPTKGRPNEQPTTLDFSLNSSETIKAFGHRPLALEEGLSHLKEAMRGKQ